jgi:hypothetical protein
VPATCARRGCALRAAPVPNRGEPDGRSNTQGGQTGAPENIVKELERLRAHKEHELSLRLEWAPERSGPYVPRGAIA